MKLISEWTLAHTRTELLEECCALLANVSLHINKHDERAWNQLHGGGYTVKVTYNLLRNQSNIEDSPSNPIIWNIAVLLRVSLFAWFPCLHGGLIRRSVIHGNNRLCSSVWC